MGLSFKSVGKKLLDPRETKKALGGEENKDPETAAREYATAKAEVGEAVMMTARAFEHLGPEANKAIGKFADHFETTAEKFQVFSNQLLSTFDFVFTEALIREKNFADSMVAGFRGMLERMVAEMLARAAVFGVLNFITGGAFGIGAGGFSSFVTAPITGVSPSVGSRGSSTTNINMPNVTMINSRSIGQIKQALTLHDRRH